MVTPRRRVVDPRPKRALWACLLVIAVVAAAVMVIRFPDKQENPHPSAVTVTETVRVIASLGAPATPSRSISAADLFLATDSNFSTIVNKKHQINPQNYVPGDLTGTANWKLRKEAAIALVRMQEDSGDSVVLEPESCYRSYKDQVTTYTSETKAFGEEHANRVSAKPGYSEHQLGLAVDFAPVNQQFVSSSSFAWLKKNAHNYGYVLRYPEDKAEVTGYSYEPWHWRYVGIEVATDMNKRNIATLEEYYGVTGGGYN